VSPVIFGFDPLVQFVEEDDVVRALEHVVRHELPGTFNVAGAGRLPWSEVLSICGARPLPLPPWRPALALAPLIRLGRFELPPELAALLRYGRGMDTRRLVDQGFRYRYTSAGAVESFVEAKRLRRGTGHRPESYVYERDVEQFFQHSPTVIRSLEP
jgi:UDP-glucose 4-epimerase